MYFILRHLSRVSLWLLYKVSRLVSDVLCCLVIAHVKSSVCGAERKFEMFPVAPGKTHFPP